MIRNAPSSSLVDRTIASVANVVLFKAATYACAIGVVIIMLGLFLEVRGVENLYHAGGAAAVQYYDAGLAYEAREFSLFLSNGARFELKSFGGNQQALGMLIACIGPIIIAMIICSARVASWLRKVQVKG